MWFIIDFPPLQMVQINACFDAPKAGIADVEGSETVESLSVPFCRNDISNNK